MSELETHEQFGETLSYLDDLAKRLSETDSKKAAEVWHHCFELALIGWDYLPDSGEARRRVIKARWLNMMKEFAEHSGDSKQKIMAVLLEGFQVSPRDT